MTKQQAVTLRRLVTDLEPFTTALQRTADSTEGELAAQAFNARVALEGFISFARNRLAERK